MPYKSRAQQGLFHSPNSPVSAKVVAEWDKASKGQHNLPQHVKHPQGNDLPMRFGEHSQSLPFNVDEKPYRPGWSKAAREDRDT